VTGEIILLAGTAATIGLAHTILGPDHYLPFIVLSKTRKWGVAKTTLITLLCGIGHILSSVILGFIGIAIGAAVFSIQAIESFRGEIAVWILIVFGFTYMIWGIHRALRSTRHDHHHFHQSGEEHSHSHDHLTDHLHVHTEKSAGITPWVLFIIFILGPCEPLIPLVMYPAAEHKMVSVLLVATAFGLTTIATMLSMVLASYYGLSKISLPKLERYSHALAGLAIVICGAAVKLLGL
jgi:nickel/cobalt exporter